MLCAHPPGCVMPPSTYFNFIILDYYVYLFKPPLRLDIPSILVFLQLDMYVQSL